MPKCTGKVDGALITGVNCGSMTGPGAKVVASTAPAYEAGKRGWELERVGRPRPAGDIGKGSRPLRLRICTVQFHRVGVGVILRREAKAAEMLLHRFGSGLGAGLPDDVDHA